ncbi:DUF2894 domain-containing protein [Inhella sp.]|uniref:DUF2894 domain-containing protein n=1 Tax=Inhella sp. TaxID=1921806 RepID=UPI0035B4C031
MDAQALHQDPEAALQAHPLRAHTAPARWAVLQGLTRRAAQQQGALREVLLHKLAARLAALPAPSAEAAPEASCPSPLQALALAPRPPELQAFEFDRRDWTRLRLAQRLDAAPAPTEAPNAQLGPLHTQVLVPQALAQLRELSPEYLQRLMVQLDQLMALTPGVSSTPVGAKKGRRRA